MFDNEENFHEGCRNHGEGCHHGGHCEHNGEHHCHSEGHCHGEHNCHSEGEGHHCHGGEGRGKCHGKGGWGGKRENAGRKCENPRIPFNRRLSEESINKLKEYAAVNGITETEALERAIQNL